MSGIKNFLLEQQEEEQDLLMCYLDWVEENQELFQQLKETWKPVEGFPGYEVSDKGRFRSYLYKTPRVLKEGTTSKGYKSVVFRKNNKSYCLQSHRVVCKNFHPNPNNLPVVLHLDNNKKNNKVENLKWGTQSENIRQSHKEGRQVWTNPNPITFVLKSPTGEVITTDNLTQFGRDNKLDPSLLNKVILGKRNHHKGWTSLSSPVLL